MNLPRFDWIFFFLEKENKDDDNSYTIITIDNDTLSSRFTEFLLRHLLKGTDAKDKNVRFHVCQLIALIINSIGTIEWVKFLYVIKLLTSK